MEKKKLSKDKVEEILKELGRRKGANKINYHLATRKETENIIGNVAACTDCDDDGDTDGGAGNVSGCSDDVCEDIVGNVAACTDCDDDSDTDGGAGNVSGCSDDVC